jgi:hypothetical protein
MPEIIDRFSFMPGTESRQLWLATRKRPFACGNIRLPGFYQTVDYGKDTGWFIMAMVIEIAAFSLTLYGGIMRGGIYLLGASLIVVLFLVLDYVGVILYHANAENKCFLRNRFLIEDGVNRGLIENEMRRGKGKEVFGIIFLFLSSLLKIFAVLLLTRYSIVFYVILAIFYVLVIYIHMAHTGYWFSEWRTQRKIDRDYRRRAHDIGRFKRNEINESDVHYMVNTNQPLISVFETPIRIQNIAPDKPITVGSHSLSFDYEDTNGGGQPLYHYTIRTVGILFDSDIILFAGGQLPMQAGVIAINCLQHQLNVVHPAN